jgi:hypothetical protein
MHCDQNCQPVKHGKNHEPVTVNCSRLILERSQKPCGVARRSYRNRDFLSRASLQDKASAWQVRQDVLGAIGSLHNGSVDCEAAESILLVKMIGILTSNLKETIMCRWLHFLNEADRRLLESTAGIEWPFTGTLRLPHQIQLG